MAALLEAGAYLHAKNAIARTALHVAAWNGHAEAVTALLAAGLDPNAQDSEGATPAHYAEDEGHEVIANLLREHGAVKTD
jgi:cytohesin